MLVNSPARSTAARHAGRCQHELKECEVVMAEETQNTDANTEGLAALGAIGGTCLPSKPLPQPNQKLTTLAGLMQQAVEDAAARVG